MGMPLAAVLFSLGACREGWTPLGSRCVLQTKGDNKDSSCAAECASVVRPWVANDTGGVPMCIKSKDEYDFLDSWVIGPYWTGFRRQGVSDGVVPPADWRTAVVHPQGSACSAGANPWFDSLMSHQRASPLLEHCTARPAPHLFLRGCTAALEDHPVWSMNEPSTADRVCMSSPDEELKEQNCIVRDHMDWREYTCVLEAGLSPSPGYWCAEVSPETDLHGPAETAERRAHAMCRGRRTSRCEFTPDWGATPACLCELPNETVDPCECVPRPLLNITSPSPPCTLPPLSCI